MIPTIHHHRRPTSPLLAPATASGHRPVVWYPEHQQLLFVIWLPGEMDAFKQSANSPDGVTRPHIADKDTGTYIRVRHQFS